MCNLIKIYTIWLNNYLGWAGPLSWTSLGGFSSGFSWAGLKNLAHDPPTTFTVQVGLDWAFRELSPHAGLARTIGHLDLKA